MKTLRNLALIVFALVGLQVTTAHAVATYGFENQTVGTTTPILAAAPDSGDASFRTDFTASPAAGAFSVFPFAAGFQPAFSGHFLSSQGADTSILTLTFNEFINGLSLDFAENVPNSAASGTFQVVIPSQTFTVGSADIGGATFEGGSVNITGAIAFSTVQLKAFNAAGAPIAFAIDNLTLTTAVPEPGTLLLLGLGFGVLALRLRRT